MRSEARIEPDVAWVETGGKLILPAGFTERREANIRSDSRAGGTRARHAIERVCSSAFGRQVEVGFAKCLGTGLSRDAYRASIDEGRRESLDVYALVPNRLAAPDYGRRAVFELRLLAALGQRELGFRVPRVFGALRDSGGVILVEELVEGLPLDSVAEMQSALQPWRVIAEIAVKIHAVPVDELPEGLLAPRDCRTHAESTLDGVGAEHRLTRLAREWMAAHLPPREPGVLLHGDLLGQNVHLGFDGPPGVIDWERAEVGDPAYDLAIVTRGTRRPFKKDGGVKLLLDAYAAAGGRPLSPTRVQFFELSILAAQLERAVAEDRDVQGAEQRLSALLKRLGTQA